MPFPSAQTLKENAEKLSRPSLKVGVADAAYSRGASEIMDIMPFGASVGKSHDYVIKGKNPAGTAARDPRGRSRPATGAAQRVKQELMARQLARHAETALYDVNVTSDTNQQQVVDLQDEAASLYEEFLMSAIHGTGGEIVPDGIDRHLRDLSGHFEGGSYTTVSGKTIELARGQKTFATENGTPTGTKVDLYPGMVDELISKIKGGRDNVRILSNLDSWVDFKKSLNMLGGNTTNILIEGVQRPAYDNVPWIVSDNIGQAKISYTGGGIASGSDALTISDDQEANDVFIGFDDLDIGRGITVQGAGADGADLVTTIAAVTNRTSVVLAANAATTVSGAQVKVHATNAIYCVRFDATKGFSAFYAGNKAASESSYNADAGEYYGTVSGFDVTPLGISQQGGVFDLHLLTWEGNFALFEPFAAARVSHFGLANA